MENWSRRPGPSAAVVAVSHLRPEELGRLLASGAETDAVIGPKIWESESRGKGRIELPGRAAERSQAPAALVYRNADGMGRVSLEFTGARAGKVLAAVSFESIPTDPEESAYSGEHAQIKEKIVRYMLATRRSLPPVCSADPRGRR